MLTRRNISIVTYNEFSVTDCWLVVSRYGIVKEKV